MRGSELSTTQGKSEDGVAHTREAKLGVMWPGDSGGSTLPLLKARRRMTPGKSAPRFGNESSVRLAGVTSIRPVVRSSWGTARPGSGTWRQNCFRMPFRSLTSDTRSKSCVAPRRRSFLIPRNARNGRSDRERHCAREGWTRSCHASGSIARNRSPTISRIVVFA